MLSLLYFVSIKLLITFNARDKLKKALMIQLLLIANLSGPGLGMADINIKRDSFLSNNHLINFHSFSAM